jgi:ribosome-binding protein aMBF1 (putative translation factor)
MITNQRQYKITLAQAEKFEKALQALKTSDEALMTHPVRRKMHEDALQSQLENLQDEIAVFERLQRQESHEHLPVESVDGLAIAMIQARIVSGMTQKQLAERLGLKEQQIQRYEATHYRAASLARVREVMDALNVTVEGHLIARAA